MTKHNSFMIAFTIFLAAFFVITMPAGAYAFIPFIAAIGAAIGWGTVAQIALGVAMSALARSKARKMAQEARNAMGIKGDVTTDGGTNSQSLIFGHYATSGNKDAADYTHATKLGDQHANEFLTQVISISDAPITGVHEIYIDGELFQIQPQKVSGDEEFEADLDKYGRRIGGKYDKKIFIRIYDGTQVEADPLMIDLFSAYPHRPWSGAHKLKGIAYAIITCVEDTELFKGFPEFRFVVQGVKLYDFRKDSTVGGTGSQRWNNPATWEFSENPIIQAYNIIRGYKMPDGHIYGIGASADSFDLTKWAREADKCDAAGTQPASTNWKHDRKMYTSAYEISVADEEPLEIVDLLLESCGGAFYQAGGKYYVVCGKPNPVSSTISDKDVLISEVRQMVAVKSLNETYNAVHATYPSPLHRWEPKEAVPYRNADWVAQDDGRELPVSLDFRTVTNGRQVRRLMRELAKDNRRVRQHVITLPPRFTDMVSGDTIAWTSAEYGYASKLFEVTEKKIDPLTLNNTFNLRERDWNDYDFDSAFDSIQPDLDKPIDLVKTTIAGIKGLTVYGTAIRVNNIPRKPAIFIGWDTTATYAGIAYEIREVYNNEVVKKGTISDLSIGHILVSDNINADTAYEVRAKANKANRNLQWSQWIPVTTPDVKIGKADIDTVILNELDDNIAFIEETNIIIQDMLDDVASVKADIQDNFEAAQGLIDDAKGELNADLLNVRGEITSSLNIAKGYTDTSIQTEQTSRQTAIGAMSARIDTLTATIASAQLIKNGNFSIGAGVASDNWTNIGAVSKGAANSASADLLIATMPETHAISLNSNANNGVMQVISDPEYVNGDTFEYRFQAGAAGAAARNIRVDVKFFNATNTEITPAYANTHSIQANNIWRTVSAGVDMPADVKRMEYKVTHASTSGQRILVTGVKAQLRDTSLVAEVAELKATVANEKSTLANHISTTGTKFDDQEALISNETIARTTDISALTIRANDMDSKTDNQQTDIGNIQTGLTTANESIAQQEEYLEAKFNVAELIPDGQFLKGFAKYGSNNAIGSIATKSATKTGNMTDNMPAPFALSVENNGAVYREIKTDYINVSPEEMLDWSVSLKRGASGALPQIAINFYDNDKVLVSENLRRNLTETGEWITVAGSIQTPANATFLRYYIIRAAANAGSARSLITNISLKRRLGFEAQSAASITRIDLAMTDTNSAVTSIQQRQDTDYNDLNGRVNSQANSMQNYYTKSQTNSAISAAISTQNAAIDLKLGGKANSESLIAVTDRVQIVEDGLLTESGKIEQYKAQMDIVETTADGKGEVIYSSSAPAVAKRKAQNLWIDLTSGNNTPKRWSGSAWVAVSDKAATDALARVATKAEANTVSTLASNVSIIDGKVEAHSTRLDSMETSVGKFSASGKVRITSESTPTGATARVAFRVVANDNASSTSTSSGFWMRAHSNGTSSIQFQADRVSFVTSSADNAKAIVPMKLVAGSVKIAGAHIENLSIGRASIAEGAITGYTFILKEAAHRSSKTGDIGLCKITFKKGRAAPTPIYFAAEYPQGAEIFLQRQIGSGSWTTVKAVRDTVHTISNSGKVTFNNRSGEDHLFVDKWMGSGTVSYRLLARTFTTINRNYGGGGSESSWVTVVVRADHSFKNSFIGAFNAHK